MFKKSRKKIVLSIMSILVILWIATLGLIYALSYYEMSNQNRKMIKAHADMYVMQKPANEIYNDKPVKDFEKPGFIDTPRFQLSTFYTVVISYDGKILEIQNDREDVYSEEYLKKLALNVFKDDKSIGTKDNLLYYVKDKAGYILVTFMDNTLINEGAATLIRYTLIFGGIIIILFFFLSVFLAKKIVKPLEESYIKQKQFISDAGHELKTPVSVISANAEILNRELGENQWLSNIQYENERMGMLVSQLLDLARNENTTPNMEKIDLSYLVSGEILPFESVAFENNLFLDSNITENITILGNENSLKQLISILVDNAIRHSNSKKGVYISLKREHNTASLSVINSGESIPKDKQDLIFERFYRVDTARNSDDKHYGLGLSIAKSIVASHKGNIKVLCYDGLVEFLVQFPILN